jgi:inner membrane protein
MLWTNLKKHWINRESIILIIVKPTAFNIILWNANVATTASYLLADYSLLDSPIYYIYYLQQEQSFRIAVKWEFRFWKTKKKTSEGWYISQKNKSLYFQWFTFWFIETQRTLNLLLAMNLSTESELKAVEVPKAKETESVYFYK